MQQLRIMINVSIMFSSFKRIVDWLYKSYYKCKQQLNKNKKYKAKNKTKQTNKNQQKQKDKSLVFTSPGSEFDSR